MKYGVFSVLNYGSRPKRFFYIYALVKPNLSRRYIADMRLAFKRSITTLKYNITKEICL